MIEHKQTTDGQPLLTGIHSLTEARDALTALGKEIVRQGVLKIYTNDWYTGAPRDRGYVHIHFFGKDDRELAYYTPELGFMLVFNTPRTWHPDFTARLEEP